MNSIDALNTCFHSAVKAGDFLCLDESMIKSFHKDLKGKMKIIIKLSPLRNECRNLCKAISKIVLNIELYEGHKFMADNMDMLNELEPQQPLAYGSQNHGKELV